MSCELVFYNRCDWEVLEKEDTVTEIVVILYIFIVG